MGGIRRRTREVTNHECLKGFTGRESIDSIVLQASQVAYAGVDEQQTVTITGGPTGGDFTLTFKGETATIPYNATADAVETLLEAEPSIGAGNVRVTGGALPGTPIVITFQRDLGRSNQPTLVADGSGLTGGTTPAVVVTTTRAGSDTDSGRLLLICGTILTKVPGDDTKYREFTGASGEAVEGILARDTEFVTRDETSDIDAPMYVFGARFDKTKIVNYNTHQAALATWAAAHASRFD